MSDQPPAAQRPGDHHSARAAKPITVWSIAPSVYLPALVFEIGNGAIAPVIALTALDLGASPTTAGFMLALLGIGQLIGDVPSGAIASRLGDRRAMMFAAGVAVVVLLGCYFTRSTLLLGASLLILGMCTSMYYLARQAYLTELAPLAIRARAISTLGGSHRIGLFIGPFVGAAAIKLFDLHAAYIVAMITSFLAAGLLLVIPDVDPGRIAPRHGPPPKVGKVIAEHRQLFLTLGFAVLAVGAVRGARQTVLPLWSEHIGYDAATTSLVFGIANAVDMALFYPAGKVMDRFGRLSVALPSMIILGGAMACLPLTHGLVLLTATAMIMSFGNGIGSGIMQTIGADVSPAESRLQFLSVWRVMSDTGNAVGPTIVSIVASVWTLAAGITVIGLVGLLAAAGLSRWVPRYSAFATRAMVRNHRARADPPG